MRNDKGFTLIELLIVVAIIGIIAAIAIPSLLNALDRARQTTTVENLQKFGQSVEQYIMDNNKVGSPKTGDTNIEDLQTIFKETEINMNDSMIKDGWGSLFIYEFNATLGSKLYTLTSYGSDSAAGPAPVTVGVVKTFPEDIIWVNGHFSQRPEGSQKSEQ